MINCNYYINLFQRIVRAVLVMLLFSGMALQLEAQSPGRADQVKAVFLFNFIQFVDWPPNSFNNSNAPFVIGVYGTDPFGSYLDSAVAGERVNGHPIIVHRFNDIKDARASHILFVNKNNPAEPLRALSNRSVLTVSDANDFVRSGGMIRFFVENNKIRLQINLKAAKAANLNISSKLLRVADVIEK